MTTYIPRPYQTQITNYILAKERCAVFAGMGMGKTAATLEALAVLDIVDPGPTLIIAPLRVARTVWSDEISKWDVFKAMRIIPILGSVSERKKAIKQNAAIYTTHLGLIPWLIEYYGDKWPFTKVVVDESSRLKGFRSRQGTKRARALGKYAHTKIKRIIQLTGTPCSNGVVDLWGPTWFLDKGARLGETFTAFSNRWFRPDWSGYNLTPLPQAQKEIEEKLSDICLSLKAEDWFDLKESIVNKIYVDLPAKARALYKDMEKDLFIQLKKHSVEAFNAASKTVKCLQLSNGAIYVDKDVYEEVHDEKLQALESIIEESSGAPIIVVYNFRSDIDRLHKRFPKGRVLDSSPKTIKDWNAGKIPVMFIHPQSAGHGLSLQHGGNIIVFFGMNWSLEDHLQVIERIGPVRQLQSGYNRSVFIHYILAKDTIDDLVLERLKSKRSVQDILLEAMKVKI